MARHFGGLRAMKGEKLYNGYSEARLMRWYRRMTDAELLELIERGQTEIQYSPFYQTSREWQPQIEAAQAELARREALGVLQPSDKRDVYHINPLRLRYRWRNLQTGASGVSCYAASLTITELEYRKAERIPLEPGDLATAIAKWNASAPNVWRYEAITSDETE